MRFVKEENVFVQAAVANTWTNCKRRSAKTTVEFPFGRFSQSWSRVWEMFMKHNCNVSLNIAEQHLSTRKLTHSRKHGGGRTAFAEASFLLCLRGSHYFKRNIFHFRRDAFEIKLRLPAAYALMLPFFSHLIFQSVSCDVIQTATFREPFFFFCYSSLCVFLCSFMQHGYCSVSY